MDFMHAFWTPDVGPEDSILEVGCNAGANLNRLRELGYSRLSGIEINPTALDVMRSRFPALAASAEIHFGSLEEILPSLPDQSVDVVFSVWVLVHVHPASHALFREMVRVARRLVCTLEGESSTVSYVFARNYRRVFEALGCAQRKSAMATGKAFPELGPEIRGSVIRLMGVPARSF